MNIVTEYHETMRAKSRAKKRSHQYLKLHNKSMELLTKILQKNNRLERKRSCRPG